MQNREPAASGWRNARILAICQALYVAALSIDLTLTGLVGYSLAENKAYATLPFSLITVAAALTTIFASLWMQKIGRKRGFMFGSLICASGGILSVYAILQHHFFVFCLGTACIGVYQAFAQYYRLAAADGMPLERKSRAISLVMGGGVLAAILGPLMVQGSRSALPGSAFAGAYALVTLLGLLSTALLAATFRDADPVQTTSSQAAHDAPRPWRKIVTQPAYLAALANNMIGYAVMMFIMTATPLAMVGCNYGINDGVSVIQWHLLAMYAPSFVTGWLIQRCGLAPVLFSGIALCMLSAFTSLQATSLLNFYLALICLGLGWNFMFVGGTTLLARSYRPSERGKAQATSEFSTFTITALASLAAGQILHALGWTRMNLLVLPLLACAALMTVVWLWRERRVKSLHLSVNPEHYPQAALKVRD